MKSTYKLGQMVEVNPEFSAGLKGGPFHGVIDAVVTRKTGTSYLLAGISTGEISAEISEDQILRAYRPITKRKVRAKKAKKSSQVVDGALTHTEHYQ